MEREGKLAEAVAYKIVSHRVNIPTWVVLYINILISTMVGYSAYWQESIVVYIAGPFSGRLWTLMLLGASLITLHGLLVNRIKSVTLGAGLGYIAWVLALIPWLTPDGNLGEWIVPLIAFPMLFFFGFVHLKYSIIRKWEESLEEEKG